MSSPVPNLHVAAAPPHRAWTVAGHLFANEEQAQEVTEAAVRAAAPKDPEAKVAAAAEVEFVAKIQPGALHGHTRAFVEKAAAATATVVAETVATAIDSVAGPLGLTQAAPGGTRTALAVVTRADKPDTLVLFAAKAKTADSPPELAVDYRLKLTADSPTRADAMVMNDRGYGTKMMSIADVQVTHPIAGDNTTFRLHPIVAPSGLPGATKHEDFDITVADDETGKALCTYLIKHTVAPPPAAEAAPAPAEEAAGMDTAADAAEEKKAD